MNYQTLYRKYRSKGLGELVGQSHIVQTINNAIKLNRLSHAYIFSGPRGTGKTSTARILAKMVNATNDDFNACDICQKISAGVCVDVIEIDAASHTGVDHMRQLTEQVQFLPVEAKYKVFIIDEVHMLSTGAFNALLKTLEEPPENILFILATTELHKIPATIQSRAQTLNFRPIKSDDIFSHLQLICKEEGVEVEDLVLKKVVQYAKGGMRDALSLLDQLISVSDNQRIVVSDIDLILGTVQSDQLESFLLSCFNGDSDGALKRLSSFLDDGVNVFQLYDDILNLLKGVLLDGESLFVDMDKKDISIWMIWFTDQLAYLKTVPYPDVVSQVKLFHYLTDIAPDSVRTANTVSPVVASDPVPSVSTTSKSVVNKSLESNSTSSVISEPNIEDPPDVIDETVDINVVSTEPNKEVLDDGVSDTTSAVVSDLTAGPKTKDDIWKLILHRVDQEFKVLMPVLSGSSIIEHKNVLYLIIEQTYGFFEKKLSEKKYSDWFLLQYNQLADVNLTEMVVTSNVNDVYQQMSQDDSSTEDNSQVESKTVNQIVELFEGQIIS